MGALKNRPYRLTVVKKQLGFRTLRRLWQTARSALPFWLDQVPEIAVEIGEHGHRAVGLEARRLAEPDAPGEHRPVVAGDIVGLEEQEEPATRLVADAACLLGVGRFGQEQSGALPASRRDHHPALAAAEIDILGKGEAELFD